MIQKEKLYQIQIKSVFLGWWFLFIWTIIFQNFLSFDSAAECYSTELQWPILIICWIPWTKLEPSFTNSYDDSTYPHLFLAQLTRHSYHSQLKIIRAEQSEPTHFRHTSPFVPTSPSVSWGRKSMPELTLIAVQWCWSTNTFILSL